MKTFSKNKLSRLLMTPIVLGTLSLTTPAFAAGSWIDNVIYKVKQSMSWNKSNDQTKAASKDGNRFLKKAEDMKNNTTAAVAKELNQGAREFFNTHGTDLTDKFAKSKQSVAGYEHDADELIDLLAAAQNSDAGKNVSLVADRPGSGRQQLINKLAYYSAHEPEKLGELAGKRFIQLDLDQLVAQMPKNLEGKTGHAQAQLVADTIKEVKDALKQSPDVVLVIDEFHRVFGNADGASMPTQIAQYYDELRKVFKDPGLSNQVIAVSTTKRLDNSMGKVDDELAGHFRTYKLEEKRLNSKEYAKKLKNLETARNEGKSEQYIAGIEKELAQIEARSFDMSEIMSPIFDSIESRFNLTFKAEDRVHFIQMAEEYYPGQPFPKNVQWLAEATASEIANINIKGSRKASALRAKVKRLELEKGKFSDPDKPFHKKKREKLDNEIKLANDEIERLDTAWENLTKDLNEADIPNKIIRDAKNALIKNFNSPNIDIPEVTKYLEEFRDYLKQTDLPGRLDSAAYIDEILTVGINQNSESAFDNLIKSMEQIISNNSSSAYNSTDSIIRDTVSIEDFAQTIANETKVNVEQILAATKGSDYVEYYKQYLEDHIVGQRHAIKALVTALSLHFHGLKKTDSMVGMFLALGPSRVGKSLTGEKLGELAGERSFLQINGPEYKESHNIATLQGAPAGYVGYEDGGKLFNHVLENPNAVILVDELEKADPALAKLFLGLQANPIVYDGLGRRIDFSNTTIVFTANSLDEAISTGQLDHLANIDKQEAVQILKGMLRNDYPEMYRKEFLNRMEEIILYKEFGASEKRQVVKSIWNEFTPSIESKGRGIELDEEVINFIADNTHKANSAEINAMIRDEVSARVIQLIDNKLTLDGDIITVRLGDDNMLIFDVESVDGVLSYPQSHIDELMNASNNPNAPVQGVFDFE